MRHVIGLGNLLHGDDGVGPTVCRLLAANPQASDVMIFDVGTRGLDALAVLQDCREAILIDAARPQHRPGLIRSLSVDELETRSSDIHGDGLATLLSALPYVVEHMPRVRLITIEAKDVRRFDPRLSPEVWRSCRELARRLTKEFSDRAP